jgi:hypothetical protein
MHPGSHIPWGCRLQFCLDDLNWSKGSLSVLSSIGETEKMREGGWGLMFLARNSQVKKKCEMVGGCDATASSFVVKVRREVLANVHAVTVKCHSKKVK